MESNVTAIGGDRADDRKDIACGVPKSPWKTSPALPLMVEADSESWPALSNSQQRIKNNNNVNVGQGPAPADVVAPSVTLPQPTLEQQKFNGRGHPKPQRRPYVNQNKNGFKPRPNGASPFPVPLQQFPRAFRSPFQTRLPVPTPAAYSYQFSSGPDERRIMSGVDHAQPFVPSVSGPPVHSQLNIHASSYTGRMATMNGQGGFTSPSWPNQLSDMHLQQSIGPRHLVRPPHIASPGTPMAVYAPHSADVYYNTDLHSGYYHQYPPAHPSGAVGGVPYQQHVFPYSMNTGVAMRPSSTAQLKAELVKQIEYYFSDQNLQGDAFLIALMDEEGWVPISSIADFNRVKRKNVGIPLILDALRVSETIEIQDEKIRRRGEWSKWVRAPQTSKLSSLDGSALEIDDNEIRRKDSGGKNDLPEEFCADTLQKSIEVASTSETGDISLSNPDSFTLLDVSQRSYPCSEYGSGNQPETSGGSDNPKLMDIENFKDTNLQSSVDQNIHRVDALCDDISSTFVLHEDLETDKSLSNRGHLGDSKGKDQITASDEVVDRLIIVIQGMPMSEAAGERSKDLQKPCSQKVEKNCSSEQILRQQGHDNFRVHGSPKRCLGCMSESTSLHLLGFFLKSTLPDVHGLEPSKLSNSLDSNHSKSSPLAHSIPESFHQFQYVNPELLGGNGFKQMMYKNFRSLCLDERKRMGTGHSEKMNALYELWSFFLVHHSHCALMYDEFRKLALEDAAAGCYHGLELLLGFYSCVLEKKFRQDLYEDFEEVALDLLRKGNTYGLKHYSAFHLETKEALKMHPELDRVLKEEPWLIHPPPLLVPGV